MISTFMKKVKNKGKRLIITITKHFYLCLCQETELINNQADICWKTTYPWWPAQTKRAISEPMTTKGAPYTERGWMGCQLFILALVEQGNLLLSLGSILWYLRIRKIWCLFIVVTALTTFNPIIKVLKIKLDTEETKIEIIKFSLDSHLWLNIIHWFILNITRTEIKSP